MENQAPPVTFTLAGDDAVLPFAVEPLDVRGRAVQLGPMLDNILTRHDYPEPVSRLLAEMVVLTILLGSSLKFDGQFIVQTQTDGPVGLLVVDFRTPGDIRAYARVDEAAVAEAIAAGNTKPEDLLGKGVLIMTIDQGKHMQRYQGVVQLAGESLEEAAHQYFRQSEQIPTRVRLAAAELVDRDEDGNQRHSWRAGGLIVQFLPESEDRIKSRDLHAGDAPEGVEAEEIDDDDAWVEAHTLASTIKDDELTDPAINSEALLYRLFNEHGVRVFDPVPMRDHCSCDAERIWSMLKNLPDEDYGQAVVDGQIEVKCDFCGTYYNVTPEELGRPLPK